MNIIGRGRYARSVYPDGIAAANAAAGALRNRNVANLVTLVGNFTPNNSLIAAISFTPRVSGVLQASATISYTNDANVETYEAAIEVFQYTNLVITGGATTINGWVVGSTVPPVVAGTSGPPALVAPDIRPTASGALGNLSVFGISDPVPIGVPALVFVLLTQVGGGHPLTVVGLSSLSVMELP